MEGLDPCLLPRPRHWSPQGLICAAIEGEGKTIEYHGSSYARVNGTKTIEFRFRRV